MICGPNRQHFFCLPIFLFLISVWQSGPIITTYVCFVCNYCICSHGHPCVTAYMWIGVPYVCQCSSCILSSSSCLLCIFSPSQLQRGEPQSDLSSAHARARTHTYCSHSPIPLMALSELTPRFHSSRLASSLIAIPESYPSQSLCSPSPYGTLPCDHDIPRGLLPLPGGMSGVTPLFQRFY